MRRVALPDAERAACVRAGGDTSLTLTENGRMFVWGNTEYGQALCDSGDQLRTPTAAPCDIPLADARLGGSFVVLRDGTYAVRMHARTNRVMTRKSSSRVARRGVHGTLAPRCEAEQTY